MALYAKVACAFPDDPKVIEAGDLAELLYLRCILRSREALTDGVVDRRVLSRWAAGIRGKPETHAKRLVAANLWVECAEGWRVPQQVWVKWNPTAAEVEDKRAAETERKRKQREARLSQRDKDGIPDSSEGRPGQPEPEPEPEPEPLSPNGSTSTREAAPAPTRSERVRSTIGLLADWDVAHGNPRNPRALRERCYTARERDHSADLHRLAYEHDEWTAQQLRDAVLDVPQPNANVCALCDKPNGAGHNDWTCTVGQKAKAGTS